MGDIKIKAVNSETVSTMVELLGQYQSFYGATPNDGHNLKFLKHFLTSDEGIFFIGYDGSNPVGYVSLYFSYSSVTAKRIAILNDLYVRDSSRNNGFGKQLIDYAINYAHNKKITQVRWCTRISNEKAQKLYSKYDAKKTDWLHYDLSK